LSPCRPDHALTIEYRWAEVADLALQFVEKHAPHRR
jgi:hypothetical protein